MIGQKGSATRLQVRQLFVRTMRDSGGMAEGEGLDQYSAAAFVGRMVGQSQMEVGMECLDLFDGNWKRYAHTV